MKISYLLNILIVNLEEIIKVISKSIHNTFVIELVMSNYRSIYDGLVKITKKDDEDAFIVKHYYDEYFRRKMDYYAQSKNVFTKEQYIAEVRKMIDVIIDNAARKGYIIEQVDRLEKNDEPGTPPDTPDTPDSTQPPKLSHDDSDKKILQLLRNIATNINGLIKIFEKYEK